MDRELRVSCLCRHSILVFLLVRSLVCLIQDAYRVVGNFRRDAVVSRHGILLVIRSTVQDGLNSLPIPCMSLSLSLALVVFPSVSAVIVSLTVSAITLCLASRQSCWRVFGWGYVRVHRPTHSPILVHRSETTVAKSESSGRLICAQKHAGMGISSG